MSLFHRKPDEKEIEASVTPSPDESAAVKTGAPTEAVSPLGYNIGSLTVVCLTVSKIVGTGVFSTPGSILKGSGSVGLSFIFWVIGFFFAGASLSVYLEFSSYFPHRSGADVVYLEKAYPKPKYLMPTAFAVQSVLLSFSSANAIVLAKYLLAAAAVETTTWRVRGLAVGMLTGIICLCIINTRLSLILSNTIGIIKLIILTFVGITGLVVLSGRTHIADPTANFRNAFAGTTSNGNGLATALVKVNYAYYGYENAFAVVSEIRNPVKTLKKCTPIALGVVFVLYMLANVAYFSAVPKEEIRKSGEMTASLFFEAVFGHSPAIVSALSTLVAISAFGNLLATVIGSSRVIRECARQGVIPFPKFWASTKPFGTPLGPYLIKYVLTAIVILAPPDGDAFNFVVDLQSYPSGVFSFLMTLGLFIVRPRVKPTQIRIWNVVLVFSLVVNAFVLIMPWVPPEGGIYGGDVSFFYATYCVVGLAIIAICGIWYWIWIKLLPRWGGYEVRQEVEVGERGERSARLVKVKQGEMEKWEMEHDEVGNRIVVGEGVEK